MPITQERFLAIVNGSAEILDRMSLLYKLAQPTSEAIANANSLLARTEDPIVREIVGALLAETRRIRETLEDIMIRYSDARVAILVERAHFQRHGKQNQRAAALQRQARINKGVVPRTEVQGFVHQGLDTDFRGPKVRETPAPEAVNSAIDRDPEFLRFQEQQRAKWREDSTEGASEARALTTQEQSASTGVSTDPMPELLSPANGSTSFSLAEMNKPDFEGEPFKTSES